MGRVAALPCAICGQNGVEVHHLLHDRIPGRKSGPWLTIPLCGDCHLGAAGLHGTRALLRVFKKTEMQMLNDTLATLYGHLP